MGGFLRRGEGGPRVAIYVFTEDVSDRIVIDMTNQNTIDVRLNFLKKIHCSPSSPPQH